MADEPQSETAPAASVEKDVAANVIDDVIVRVDRLDFSVESSMRYHQRRRAFYDKIHKLSMLGVVLLGSAAFAQVLDAAAWFGMGSASIAALDLVYSWSHKARDHEMLYRRFSDLAVDIRGRAAKKTMDDFHLWTRQRLLIEADEPATYCALEAVCYNEVVNAWGNDPGNLTVVRWYQRRLANVFVFPNTEFPQISTLKMRAAEKRRQIEIKRLAKQKVKGQGELFRPSAETAK